MSREHGFYNMDFMPFIIAMAVVSCVVGFLLYPTIGWLWDFIKPILHEATK